MAENGEMCAGRPAGRRSHRRDIQGLRAVAVLLVVLAHARVPGLRGGYVGVDVFFVLSGFLITGLLVAEAEKRASISLVHFYSRRARRILPAAVLTLVATTVAATQLLNFVRAREAVLDSVFAAGFAANFRFASRGTDYFAQVNPPSPVLHYWSLAVEEQFYLVWPLLAALALFGMGLRRRRHGVDRAARSRLLALIVLASSLSFAWAVRLTTTVSAAAYFSPLARAWELGLGATLAVAGTTSLRLGKASSLTLGWAGLAAIVASAVAYDDGTAFPGPAALLPTLGAAAVIAAGAAKVSPRGAVAGVLSLKPMRNVGDRSYAFYLWHWPVLVIAQDYAMRNLSTAENLLLLLCAFLLASLSCALVENPIRRARWRSWTGGVVVVSSAAAVVVAAQASLASIDASSRKFAVARADPVIPVIAVANATRSEQRTAATPHALPQVVAAVHAALRGARVPTRLTPPVGSLREDWNPYALPPGCVPIAHSDESSSDICRFGATRSKRSMVLVGDSHAEAWLWPLLRLARRDGWVLIPLLRPGCTPYTWLDDWGASACRVWYRWALAQIRSLKPDVALVTGSVSDAYGPQIAAAVHGTLAFAKALRPSVGRVVVIGDPYGLRRDPQDCLLTRHATLRGCMATWWAARLHPYDEIARRVRRARLGFIDTRGWFCVGRRCPAVVGRTIVYFDQRHVTAEYAFRLLDVFRAALRAALVPPHRFRSPA